MDIAVLMSDRYYNKPCFSKHWNTWIEGYKLTKGIQRVAELDVKELQVDDLVWF